MSKSDNNPFVADFTRHHVPGSAVGEAVARDLVVPRAETPRTETPQPPGPQVPLPKKLPPPRNAPITSSGDLVRPKPPLPPSLATARSKGTGQLPPPRLPSLPAAAAVEAPSSSRAAASLDLDEDPQEPSLPPPLDLEIPDPPASQKVFSPRRDPQPAKVEAPSSQAAFSRATASVVPSPRATFSPLDQELAEFHWGAFFLCWAWAPAHRVWIGLLAFLPGVGLVVPFLVGFQGRRWAWQAKPDQNWMDFCVAQRKWSAWGWLCFAGYLLVCGGLWSVAAVGATTLAQGGTADAPEPEQQVSALQHDTPDGETAAHNFADGIIACAAQLKRLPDTTQPVPERWSGTEYASQPGDWSAEAFRCAGFRRSAPQSHRYQWVKIDETRGAVIAETDFREDGSARKEFVVPVQCPELGICRVLLAPALSP